MESIIYSVNKAEHIGGLDMPTASGRQFRFQGIDTSLPPSTEGVSQVLQENISRPGSKHNNDRRVSYLKSSLKIGFLSFLDKDRENEKEKKSVVSLSLTCALSSVGLYMCSTHTGEVNGTPLQYSCLENPMDEGAWKAAVHGVAEGPTRLSDFTLSFYFPALEKEMATHSSVLAWRIPGTGEPGGLPSMGSHRVGHD